ncbi:hypothetical protein TEA_022566 [Camellia sinensis var. sinensis]|uniref:Uncharacterized protein n=1 Tax=Camellia sinensis var. sinensis TaxID=542762 RepID=A0A4S4EZZ6_CAMSN|nr:hypothetical protein TEA_022566 [Camellia sinensis var. sinensis]
MTIFTFELPRIQIFFPNRKHNLGAFANSLNWQGYFLFSIQKKRWKLVVVWLLEYNFGIISFTNQKNLWIDSSAGSYLFVSHTGFGGVAYAMAIICVRLDADAKLASQTPHSPVLLHQASDIEAQEMGDYRDILSLTRVLVCGPKSKADVDVIIESLTYYKLIKGCMLHDGLDCLLALALALNNNQGVYNVWLTLEFSGLKDCCIHATLVKELENFLDGDDEYQAYLMDMGTKALSPAFAPDLLQIDLITLDAVFDMLRYFFLITFRSYLYCTSATEMQFSSWMDARPELGHLCNNLRIVK